MGGYFQTDTNRNLFAGPRVEDRLPPVQKELESRASYRSAKERRGCIVPDVIIRERRNSRTGDSKPCCSDQQRCTRSFRPECPLLTILYCSCLGSKHSVKTERWIAVKNSRVCRGDSGAGSS